ncbi:protein kinase domain-containing protein [Frankia sp. AgKG'84/4]|uniref:protein kinase domain-containing protein n=1 Tax=Frankia sp. AgKG'84/4 TaxID=573490 RepID=UPI00200F350B|nr:protein kinase [Frankia sp. AgKG'84/4]MCL9793565.1 protein kinase [Frankia sp. AgKG'84/4]
MTDPHTTANGGPLDNRIRLAGRYRIDGLLGSGGMSEVSYGYDERLDRQVAIKLLRPAGNPPGPPGSAERIAFEEQRAINEKRFLREIRTTASLEHPGIPAVFDTGVHTFPDGSRRVWLVMQLLRGSTVHQLIEDTDYDDAPLAIARAAGIGAQVAAVLASVHAVDVVHRDIKPDNLVLVPGGFVKVLDFGIAILRGADAPPRLTQVDHTIGTPEYMSPEQHLGSVITPASDLYSLGCLLFGLLTGERVFYLTGSGVSLRELHVKADPPRVGALRPDVPTELAELVHAMLAKDSRTRPTAVDAYQALAPWAAAPPATPAGDGLDPTQPFRHPLLVVPRRSTAAGAGAWAAHPGTAVLGTPGAGTPPEAGPPEAGPPAIAQDGSAPAAAARLPNAAVDELLIKAATLADADRPAEAIDLLEAAIATGAADPPRGLDLRRALAEKLYLADRFTRAAALNDAVRADYLHYRVEPSAPWVLDCAYYAGLAYARIGEPEKALDRLRAYLDNADAAMEEPVRLLEARRTAAFMLAATGETAAALAAFKNLRRDLAAAYGSDASNELHNLDKIIDRFWGSR